MVLGALQSDPEIQVVLVTGNPDTALTAANNMRPDVAVIDSKMANAKNLELGRMVMKKDPLPIIMLSDTGDKLEQRKTFEALEAGALWVIPKPGSGNAVGLGSWAEELRKTIHSTTGANIAKANPPATADGAAEFKWRGRESSPQVIAIAASAGGPAALRQILNGLPQDYPLPILVCQHVTPGFAHGLVEWLKNSVSVPVRLCESLDHIEPGVTFSSDAGNMAVFSPGYIYLQPENDDDTIYRPSADVLFKSVAQHYGEKAAGIILTGMGDDGCEGMRELWDAGALTIGQDQGSCFIYSMPGTAKKAGVIRYEMSLDEIEEALKGFAGTFSAPLASEKDFLV
jgi:two-component system, chemotaxis family, protein-glutamate methylesterase/glutaminase